MNAFNIRPAGFRRIPKPFGKGNVYRDWTVFVFETVRRGTGPL
jgi:hypothetical protein